MSGGLRTALTVLFAAVIGAGGGILAVMWLQSAPEPTMKRPDFTLPALEGPRRSIDEWDGKVVVLNFWATWCTPCREEIPLFSRLNAEFSADGIEFLGIAIDDPEPVRGFIAEVPMSYPTLHGMESALEVAAAYGNDRGTLPYTVVIGRNGDILQRFSGQLHEPDLRPLLADLADG